MDEKRHNITLEGRCRLYVTMCNEVVSFNETEVVLTAEDEMLVICGSNLRVEEVSKTSGDVVIAADVIDSIVYRKGRKKTREGLVGRIFK